MSERHDRQRAREMHEMSVEGAIERGREKLRLAQSVLAAFAEGLGIAATAVRVQKSRTTVWRCRVWLGVQPGREQHSRSKAALIEARP